MSDEHRIRADEDIVPHLRLEKRLLTWRAADKIERLTAERAALRAQVAEKDSALEKMDGDARWTISDVEHDLTDMRLRAEHAEAERDALRAQLDEAREALEEAETVMSWMLLEGVDEVIHETCPKEYERFVFAHARVAASLKKIKGGGDE